MNIGLLHLDATHLYELIIYEIFQPGVCNAIGLPAIWQTELHQWEHDLRELHLGLKSYKQLVQPPTLHFKNSSQC